MKRKKIKKQKKILIIVTLSLLLFLSAGYAAFNTQPKIKAKGNIKDYNASWQLIKNVVTIGDGLYEDTYESGRYIYKGSNPNNYINFNNELWRIISIEKNETLKIIKDETLGTMKFDGTPTHNRHDANNTYCTLNSSGLNYSCNVWAAVNGTFTNGKLSGTVSKDSDLKIYLNETYYNNLSNEAKTQIQSSNYQIDGKKDNGIVSDYIKNTNNYLWYGKIGLIDLSDWFKASNNANCTLTNSEWCAMSDNKREDYECSYDNYLYNNLQTWTMNPNKISVRYVLEIGSSGCIGNGSSTVSNIVHARPVIHLKKDIKLNGKGTKTNPYIITNKKV